MLPSEDWTLDLQCSTLMPSSLGQLASILSAVPMPCSIDTGSAAMCRNSERPFVSVSMMWLRYRREPIYPVFQDKVRDQFKSPPLYGQSNFNPLPVTRKNIYLYTLYVYHFGLWMLIVTKKCDSNGNLYEVELCITSIISLSYQICEDVPRIPRQYREYPLRYPKKLAHFMEHCTQQWKRGKEWVVPNQTCSNLFKITHRVCTEWGGPVQWSHCTCILRPWPV